MRASVSVFRVAMLLTAATMAGAGTLPCADAGAFPAPVHGWILDLERIAGIPPGPTYRSGSSPVAAAGSPSCALSTAVRREEFSRWLEALGQSPVGWLLPPLRPLEGSTLDRYFPHPALRDARDRGLLSFPDDQPRPGALVDRYQLAGTLAAILRHLGATPTGDVVLEDVSAGDPRREDAFLSVGHRLLPESRDHFHGEWLVGRGQLLALFGRLAAQAEKVEGALPPGADAPARAGALLAALRARAFPFPLVVALAKEADRPWWYDPQHSRLEEPAPRKSLEEDLDRTVSKYGTLERTPASSLRWLARRHGRPEAAIRSELAARFRAIATGGSWLGVTPRRDPPARPLALEALPASAAGHARARRLLDGAVMVKVPGGPVELDGQTVTLSPYWIDEQEVSVERYARFLAATGHPAPSDGEFPGVFRAPEPPPPEGLTWSAQLEHPELPVVQVSWEDARAYATWVGARLPTDAQWMLAARGARPQAHPWGEHWWGWRPEHLDSIREQLRRLADGAPWKGDRDEARAQLRDPEGDRGRFTAPYRVAHFNAPWHPDADTSLNSNPLAVRPHDLTPVGSHPEGASPFGLTEVAGNVREWCADGFDPAYQRSMPARDPEAPDAGQGRVVRGGSLLFTPESDLATRRMLAPGSRSHDLGFRLAAPANP